MEIKHTVNGIADHLPKINEKNIQERIKQMHLFDFKDINLIPGYFDGASRRKIDTGIIIKNRRFDLPIVPANMESIITIDIAVKLAQSNNFYIMHRFDINNAEFVKNMHRLGLFASISVGVKQEDIDQLAVMINENNIPEYLTIDIAHGHSKMMKNALVEYRKLLPDTFIIAGNIATPEGAIDLIKWGADAIKIGVAPGATCITAMKTGFGTRNIQASILMKIKNVLEINKLKTFIIIDGGLKEEGDIAKSLALGADMCMIGNMLAGYKDSPGEIIEIGTEKYKNFYGSASNEMKNKNSYIEGKNIFVKYKYITVLERYKEIKEALQSAISYGGGKNINDLKNVDFLIRQ